MAAITEAAALRRGAPPDDPNERLAEVLAFDRGSVPEIVNDGDRTIRMGTAARTLAEPEATKKIVDLLEKIERSE